MNINISIKAESVEDEHFKKPSEICGTTISEKMNQLIRVNEQKKKKNLFKSHLQWVLISKYSLSNFF